MKSSKKIRQAYMFMTLNEDDYLVIRGKKSVLKEAYIFQVIEGGVIKYTKDCKPYMTFKVISQIPYDIYDKLEPRRASFWELLPRDIKEIRTLI